VLISFEGVDGRNALNSSDGGNAAQETTNRDAAHLFPLPPLKLEKRAASGPEAVSGGLIPRSGG